MRFFTALMFLVLAFPAANCSKNNSGEKSKKAATTTSKKQLSEQKLSTVNQLRGKLEEKREKLDETSQKLTANIEARVSEINSERAQNNIKDYNQAISNQKINNCLNAIQKAVAYNELIAEETNVTKTGIIELDGIAKQLEIDIIMLNGMEQAKVDEILNQLDLVINRIAPQANDLVYPTEPKNIKPLETLYDDYISQIEKQKEAEAKQKALAEKKEKAKQEALQRESERLEAIKIENEKRRNTVIAPNYALNFSLYPNHTKLRWCPNKNLIAFVEQGKLQVWDFINTSLALITQDVDDVIWIPNSDGQVVIALMGFQNNRQRLQYWSIKTRTMLGEYTLPENYSAEFHSWSGNYLAIDTFNNSKGIVIWDNSRKEIIENLKTNTFEWKDDSSFFYTDQTTVYLYDLTTQSFTASQNQCFRESELLSSTSCPVNIDIAWNRSKGILAISLSFAETIRLDKYALVFWDIENKKSKKITDVTSFDYIWWQPDGALLSALRGSSLIRINSATSEKMPIDGATPPCWNDKSKWNKIPDSVVINYDHVIIEKNKEDVGSYIKLKISKPFQFSWSYSGKRLAIASESGVYIWELPAYMQK